ncbi:MAG: alkaline phosphatase family protein [Nocardioidaceae bacterium]
MELPRHSRLAAGVGALALVVAGGAATAAQLTTHAGPSGDGTAVTPVGFRVTPAGSQTTLGDLPLNTALSPDGKTMLVSNDGQGTQSLQVVDTSTSKVVQTLDYASPQSLFVGLAFSPDGTKAYAAGGGQQVIHTYDVKDGRLTETAPITLPKTNPAGAAVNMFPAGLSTTADGKQLVVADHLADAASVVDTATGTAQTVAVGHTPYTAVVAKGGDKAYVTNQGADTVSVLDLGGAIPTVSKTVKVGTHPNTAVLSKDGSRLFVANGDSDDISVLDTSTDTVVKTISLAPYDGAKVGSNPLGLSLSPDGSSLYVSNSGNNDVAVLDAATGAVRGTIPTAWYPTGVVATKDKLLVANAKGLGAGPNDGPGHPDPTSPTPTSPDQYSGSMMKGTLSTVPLPLSGSRLASYTQTVRSNDGFDRPASGSDGAPAIKHVIYVVQENRTYDQVFGSLGKGNGDPSLNLFGQDSAPNQRALERRFVTLDNFYANAEVSAQGWNWSVAANSNPYAEALWPSNYSGRGGSYPSETNDPAIAPNKAGQDSYIWQRLDQAGISYRNYGFYVKDDNTAYDPALDAHTDHGFHGFDLNCPDNPDTFTPRSTSCGTPRFTEWKKEFDGYVAHDNLPDVEFLRLPNDHTSATKPGMPTPQAYVADNDLALGRLVDTVSHSKYWKNTAIFVTEDDAQNGPDHVDAHRTISQVISPYTQHGKVDSTFYSTASMLRTVENIVGVAPLTQFDTFATPMMAAFGRDANLDSYRAVTPKDAGDATNGKNAPMARQSAAQRLDKEDQINERSFNEAIWKSVKGRDATMPAPRHSLWGSVPTDTDD